MITKKILADTPAISEGNGGIGINVYVPLYFENMISDIIDKHPSSIVGATVTGIEGTSEDLYNHIYALLDSVPSPDVILLNDANVVNLVELLLIHLVYFHFYMLIFLKE